MASRRDPGGFLAELRHSIRELGELPPSDPLYQAHLGLVLTALARRVDELERRLDVMAWGQGDPEAGADG